MEEQQQQQQQQQQKFERQVENKAYGSNLTLKDECSNDLRNNYSNPGHPIAFSGIQTIYQYYNGVLSPDEIQNILKNFENYTLHKEYKELRRNISYSHFKGYQWQMDLVDIQALGPYNKGNRYILTVIDTFTRYAFCRLIPNKTGPVVLNAFKSVLSEAQRKPFVLMLDGGAEFRNKLFSEFCESQNIKVYSPDTSTHGAYIERFNRTLQSLIYKYMQEKSTYTFMDVFQDLVKTYNTRKHRMIGITPFEAETNEDTHLQIRLNLSKYYEKIKPKKVVFSVGDRVRIAKLRSKFSRGYKERFNKEIFKIYKISTDKKIPLYYISSYDEKEHIKGGFYAFELAKVGDETFKVDKILKRQQNNGENEVFVKWDGFDNTDNCWVQEKNIRTVFN